MCKKGKNVIVRTKLSVGPQLPLPATSGTATNWTISLPGPEEEGLSPSSSSQKEEHDLDIVTMTTASPSQQKGGPVLGKEGGGESRRMRREGETKQRTGGRREGPPDLDLDLVEEEAQEEERRRKSHRARQKEKRDDQREKGSRSLARSATQPGEEPDGVVRERRRRHSEVTRGRREKEAQSVKEDKRKDREEKTSSGAKDSGSWAPAQRAAFSFLRPMAADDHADREHASDNESTTSFSEVSLSAASIATAGWRDDWGAASPWEQSKGPGPWLKPSPQRLTEVLIGNRLSGQRLVGGLSL